MNVKGGGHDNNVVLGDLIGRNNCNHYTTLIDSQGNTGRGETDQPASQPLESRTSLAAIN